jgi:hypothetical protein
MYIKKRIRMPDFLLDGGNKKAEFFGEKSFSA